MGIVSRLRKGLECFTGSKRRDMLGTDVKIWGESAGYCGRKHGWLPDDYGRKSYSDLSAEEKAVADSFEGKESYEETHQNQQFYCPKPMNNVKLLGAGDIQ